MSEELFVEKPLRDQLESIGWQQQRSSAAEVMQLAKTCRIASVIRPHLAMLTV